MLLSFAQFEREVTGERIRDKIAASKKKGIWMGGRPPLGYDVQDKKLVVSPDEAETVRALFRLYLELGTVKKLAEESGHLGLATKRRIRSTRPPPKQCSQRAGRKPTDPKPNGRTSPAAIRPGTKQALLIDLLKRKKGSKRPAGSRTPCAAPSVVLSRKSWA
jgi:hypothetical protein